MTSTNNVESSSTGSSSSSSSSSSAASVQGSTNTLAHLNVTDPISVTAVSNETRVGTLASTTIDSILSRPTLIKTLTITGSEIFNVNLFSILDPWYALLHDPLINSVISSFGALRADVHITIVCTPPGNCMGALVVSALCEGGRPDTATHVLDDSSVDNVYSSFSDVFNVISFEKATTVEFDLPFVYPDDYIEMISGYASPNCWRLLCYSLSNLQSAVNTSATAEIRVYANFKNVSLANPVFAGKKEKVSRSEGFLSRKPQDRVKEALGGNTISGIASKVADVAGQVAGTIPFIAPLAGPIAAGAATLSTVASWFGFTREADVTPPTRVVQKIQSNLTTVDGIDTGDRLCMMSGSALSIDPAIGGGTSEDPFSWESVRERWSLISSFSLATTTAVGKLHELPVSPSYAGVFLGRMVLSPAGYVGLPFSMWRGGMEYLIYIPSSDNMRGMLQVFWSPDVTASGTLTAYSADPTNRLPSAAFDLAGSQQQVLQVPFSSTNMTLENVPMCDGYYAVRSPTCANGSLTFYLASPYVAPRPGTITTQVLIFARPMQDLVFAVPRMVYTKGGVLPADYPELPSAHIRLVGGPAVDGASDVIETTLLSATVGVVNVAAELTTEVMPSPRALAQKFAPLATTNTAANNIAIYRHFPPPSALLPGGSGAWTTVTATAAGTVGNHVSSNTRSPWTWLSHMTSMYCGVKGGVRVKALATDSELGTQPASASLLWFWHYFNFGPFYTTQLDSIQAGYGSATTITNYQGSSITHTLPQRMGCGMTAEATLSYESPHKFECPLRVCELPYVGVLDNFQDSQVWGIAEVYGDNTVANTRNLWIAGADDLSVVRFRRVPSLLAALLTQ